MNAWSHAAILNPFCTSILATMCQIQGTLLVSAVWNRMIDISPVQFSVVKYVIVLRKALVAEQGNLSCCPCASSCCCTNEY